MYGTNVGEAETYIAILVIKPIKSNIAAGSSWSCYLFNKYGISKRLIQDKNKVIKSTTTTKKN